jgi:hypothetical protein
VGILVRLFRRSIHGDNILHDDRIACSNYFSQR